MIFPDRQSTVLNDSSQRYKFVETSDEWNETCEVLPCFAEMYWPGYATKCIPTTIGGEAIVIQLWKGFCPQLLGANCMFPGGIGGEVGIYRRLPEGEEHAHNAKKLAKPAARKSVRSAKGPIGKAIAAGKVTGAVLQEQGHNVDKSLAAFRHPLRTPKTAGDVWYPAPDLKTLLSFRLIHPKSSQDPKKLDGGLADTFFATPNNFRDRQGYWCNRWMTRESYKLYADKHKVPLAATDFILEYRINGVLHPRW
ncbi:MAG TPA: hypothetical protein VE907_11995 [Gammaproteobacteria bacterium]|nr:hypothetical protein [Gammaproteobacteria bacterium]